MNRWESIAEQFDGIEDIGLKAILRNDVVWKWSVDQGKDRQQFIDVAAESSSQLGVGDQFAWFNHLWKTHQGRFSGDVFEGIEPSGESESTDAPSEKTDGQKGQPEKNKINPRILGS
jgi:hypothetical protein